jgi:hypothetical protein
MTDAHPQKAEDFLKKILEDYAGDRDDAALCRSLQMFARERGIGHLESLLVEDNLLFADVVEFMGQLGYRLTIKKIEQTTP